MGILKNFFLHSYYFSEIYKCAKFHKNTKHLGNF